MMKTLFNLHTKNRYIPCLNNNETLVVFLGNAESVKVRLNDDHKKDINVGQYLTQEQHLRLSTQASMMAHHFKLNNYLVANV